MFINSAYHKVALYLKFNICDVCYRRMVEAPSPTMLWRRWTPVQVPGNQSASLCGALTTRWWAWLRATSTSLESPQRTSLEGVNRWRLTFQSLHSILTVSKKLSQKFCQWFVRSEFVKMPFDSSWVGLAKIPTESVFEPVFLSNYK